MDSKAFKSAAAFAAFGMVLGSTAQAAPSVTSTVDPLVSLSVFGTSSSRAAVCGAGAAAAGAAATAAATAAQAGPGPGCVLPVLGSAPPPVVQAPMAPMAPVAVAGPGFAVGALLPLLALAALGALAFLLLDNGDRDNRNPISPT